MFKRIERIVGVFVVLMAFLIFWSPLLVAVSTLLFIVLLVLKSYYFKNRWNTDLSKKSSQLKTNQLITSEIRSDPSGRQIHTARRQLSVRTRTVDNYFSNYSMDPMAANHFLQDDSFLSSRSGPSFASRPKSSADMSYSPSIRPIRESPISQLGSLPFVKLTTNGSEQSSYELKLKPSPVKPVTVRIAPMPQNLSKMTLNRLSSNVSTPNGSTTLGATDTPMDTLNPSTDPKAVVDALKKSLRRKREPKNDIESEDIIKISANKKQRRDSNDLIQTPNGMISSFKQPVKRQAIDGTDLLYKRFKNNEILSSYSSLQSLQLSQTLKNKRKLSPDPKEPEVKTKKTLTLKEEEKEELKKDSKPDWNLRIDDEKQFRFTDDLSFNLGAINQESVKNLPRKSYVLPLHLHSMEDHERDRNKAKHRLNRFLSAVKEVSSPTSDSNEEESAIETSESSAPTLLISPSREIGLPTVPAAAIFTNSRVETSVTTTLLNTPISSVLTTTKESLSPQSISVDNRDNTSPIKYSLPNWPQNTTTIFTAKPAPIQSLFSVGTGTTTRRTAQNSRLRSRQKR